ncbi:MAG: hypothetical protein HN403_02540 [Rhodospirillales bacterium]|jgi:hypothetical protein|nr:hypothetical protein [Rhodospirillales bacterium]
MQRALRGLIQLLGALGAALAVLFVLFAWRLSSGPVSLAFLSPYVEKALSAQDGSFGVRFDDTILRWAGWERAIDVRILNVRAIGPGGAAVAVVPELSFSLSAEALLHGDVAPRSIELFRPSIQIVRREDASLAVAFGTGETASDVLAKALLSKFAEKLGGEGPLGYLARISVREADLFIVDQQLDTTWHAPSTEVNLRRDDSGIDGEISLNLEIQKRLAHVTLLGGYRRESGRLDFGIDFADIVPAVFSKLSPKLSALDAVGVPIGGTLLVSMTLDGKIEAVDFDLHSGAGRLDVPAPLSQRLNVKGVQALGRYLGQSDLIEFDEFIVDLGKGGGLVLPSSDGHRVPLTRLQARGSISTTELFFNIESIEAALGDASAVARLQMIEGKNGIAVKGEGAVRNVLVDSVGDYWPKPWGADAHDWIVANLSEGTLHEAKAEFVASLGSDGEFAINALSGEMRLENVSVDYLAPMPKARGVGGTITFDRKRLDIALSGGELNGLTSDGGALAFTGLDQVDQFLDADLTLQGDLDRALDLIDRQPLGLASAIGIDPKTSKGVASTRMRLHFMLEHDLTMDRVQVTAASKMADVTVFDAIIGHDIRNGELELRVDNKGMAVSGKVELGTMPGTLEWQKSFDEEAPVRSTYVLRGAVNDAQIKQELALDFAPFSEEFMQGAIGTEIRWDVLGTGEERMTATLDLTQASLTLPQFGWFKQPGIEGAAQIELVLQGEKVIKVPAFSIAAGDLTAQGSAAFNPEDGALARVDLDRIAFGRTDVKGALIPGRDGGWTVTVHGPSFDFAPIFGDLFTLDAGTPEDDQPGPDLSFSIELDEVWIGSASEIKKVKGTLARQDGVWRSVRLKGNVGDGKGVEVLVEPAPDGNRLLTILGDDAGDTLRTFGYYENMVGGSLKISGTFNDADSGSPLSGRMSVADFHIIRAPALTHLVSILSLTGIVEALQGQGLAFTELEVPFTRHEGVISLLEARANGISLGFTASGKIYSYAEIVDIEGTLVPAYAINSVLGNIPVLGSIFSGGEKGGGIFAATYKITGPTESPKIEVNPLSVLAPGFLRKLFGFLDGGESTSEAPNN